MSTALSTHTSNGERIAFQSLSPLSMDDFRNDIIEGVRSGERIAALFGQQSQDERAVRLYAVLADGNAGMLSLLSTDVAEKYPSLTPECPQAHWFEREIAEQCGVIPQAHPWLKPIRFQPPTLPGVTNFFKSRAKRFTKLQSGRSTGASSSPVISVFNVTVRRCCIWKLLSAINTVASNAR